MADSLPLTIISQESATKPILKTALVFTILQKLMLEKGLMYY